MESEVYDYIDKSGFRSIEKVWKLVKEKFPETKIKRNDIKKHLDEYGADRSTKKGKKKMGKSYSGHYNAWQMDIFIINRKYYLLAIHINSRFAYISDRLKNKNTASVLPALKKFINKHHPEIISCDNEGAFTSTETVEYLQKCHIELRVITEQVHSALGIINRFSRTIRDIEFNLERAGKEVDYQKIIKKYNKTVHVTTGHKPKDMLNNIDFEEAYISKCISHNSKLLQDEDIRVGDKVRFVVDRKSLAKTRYKLSPNYFIVDSIDNFKVAIMAKDGSVKTVPMYRVTKLKRGETKVPFAESIDDSKRGVIDEILEYNPKYKQAVVRFKSEKGDEIIRKYPVRFLREQIPTRVSALEMEFLQKHPDEFELVGKYLKKKIR